MFLKFDPRIGGGTNGRPETASASLIAAGAFGEESGAALMDDLARQIADADDAWSIERALTSAAESLTGLGSARLVPLQKRGLAPGFEAATVAARRGARVWGWLVLDESIERLGDRRDHVLQRLRTLGMIAGEALDQLETKTRDEANPTAENPDSSKRPTSPPVAKDEAAIPGIFDETFLRAVLPLFFNQAKRHDEPLSILYIAIDRLEAIRSLLGADLADRATIGIGRAIASRIRSSDFAARTADGRFVVVLPRANARGAMVVARDLHRIVTETASTLSEVPGLSISISIGAASRSPGDSSLAELHEAAASALAGTRGHRPDAPHPSPKRPMVCEA